MILELWVTLLVVSIVVGVLGYFTGDEPYLTVGLFFLFILAIIMLTGNIEYETGTVTATNYSYSGGVVDATNTSITYVYTAWSDTTSHRIGWGLAVISFIGLILNLRNMRNRRLERD